MGLLENVLQMKQQGMSDQDIYQTLQSQGVNPKSIQDSLNQAQIKSVVSGDEMQQSITDVPYPQDQYTQEPVYDPNTQYSGGYVDQGQTQQYSGDQGAYSYGNLNNSVEIAEQVFEEKSQQLNKKINELIEFKTLTETQVKTIDNRLKRIESTIDQLQSAILEKIGSYGTNLDTIKKEMGMMQDSFTKMVSHKVNSKK